MFLLIVQPGLQEVYAVSAYSVHQTVLLTDTSAPTTGEFKSERLRLPYSLKWIGDDRLNQRQDANRDLTIRLNPISKILTEFLIEH